jgi:hypothetical protein
MAPRTTTAAVALVAAGLALLAWVLYDAGVVRDTLRLGTLASEATVALAGLLAALSSVAAGALAWRRGHL